MSNAVSAQANSADHSVSRLTHQTSASDIVVVMIHGISRNGAGDNCNSHNSFGDAKNVLEASGYSPQQLVTLGYYGADQQSTDGQSGCDALISEIATTLDPSGNTISSDCGNTDPTTFDNNTPIETLSCYISWFLYLTYTTQGIPVQLVGHSLGGIIIRYAMYEAGQSVFYYNSDYAYTLNFAPPALVTDVVTFGTPHAGIPATIANDILCGTGVLFLSGCEEGDELDSSSSFMQNLITDPNSATPNGQSQTQWNMIGSQCGIDFAFPGTQRGCAFENENTSLQMQGGNKYYYLCQWFSDSSCYSHNGYLQDSSPALDENIDYCGNCQPEPPSWLEYTNMSEYTNMPHSLTLLAMLLLHQYPT